MPSLATWLSGQLGIFQTHARSTSSRPAPGFPYGLRERVRLLQEVERPVLVVCGEKFSDKIGTVAHVADDLRRRRRGARGRPAAPGRAADIECVQTYASGPMSEVELDHLAQPGVRQQHHRLRAEVQALAARYLDADDRASCARSRPDGAPGSLLDASI
jgi:hypothetical protein